ncbi:MAG: imidazole glycerol phosphate synthase subunit HisH [Betaproteobacteria bacterium TMED41]|nr:MAG: imidazole glycerol phosphate synthase subunit HisH [Betaproteobacteria bacterium TMED41]|tara:strand:+ start:1092 stop:1751 length:660 start_codon:yes stop_codon:yes gene_type:complete
MIAVVNVGTGNIRSIFLALLKVAPDEKICVTSNPAELKQAKKIVFPGQGSMFGCVEKLKLNGLYEEIMNNVSDRPFLGICLGKQILFDESEEGDSLGLGLLKGKVVKFDRSMDFNNNTCLDFKIPHMGWNQVRIERDHQIFKGFDRLINTKGSLSNWFYFVHSFFVKPKDPKITLAYTNYGQDFTSVVAKDNIVATQFHPEKSAKSGLLFLKNFVSWKL